MNKWFANSWASLTHDRKKQQKQPLIEGGMEHMRGDVNFTETKCLHFTQVYLHKWSQFLKVPSRKLGK